MTNSQPTSFLNLYKILLFFTGISGGLLFWAALLHTVKPIPLENLPINFNTAIFSSWPIMSGLLWFFLAHCLLGLIFATTLSLLAFFNGQFWRLSQKKTMVLAIGLWFFAILIVCLANQYFFPWSIFALLPRNTQSLFYIKISLILLSILAAIITVCALISLFAWLKNKKGWRIVAALFFFFIILLWNWPSRPNQTPLLSKPNIIIIGIDSLRPDFTGYYGSHKNLTPNIDHFLQNAVNFSNATTPLARTFPAWMSILTGKNPKQNGARLGLPELQNINLKDTLSHILQQADYKTIFAIDEQRFSNIDQHFGFNVVIGPAMGLNDFVLGAFNDFPFSNLWINTRIGKYLFPYSHANRAANITYLPATFNRLLSDELLQTQKKPLFLAIHLCLPHWPFDWAHTPFFEASSADELHRMLYENSLKVVDQQFQDVLQLLHQSKLLRNSLVIVMSDHGQGLGLAGERLTPINKMVASPVKLDPTTFTALTRLTYGHGTDVLNRSQFHIIFAVKKYGSQPFADKNLATPVSLIDIRPTVLDFLHLADWSHTAGISLMPLLTGSSLAIVKPRSFYMETGLTIPGILIANPSLETALHQGLKYFTIEPTTGKVIVKPEFVPLIIAGKQRAILSGYWLLAHYPITKNVNAWVLVNLVNGFWTYDLNTKFAKQAPVTLLMQQLKLFYGDEI